MQMKPEEAERARKKTRTGRCVSVFRWRGRGGDRACRRGDVIYGPSKVLPLGAPYLERVRVIADCVGRGV